MLSSRAQPQVESGPRLFGIEITLHLSWFAIAASHAMVARARGVAVPSITLWALGGIAQEDVNQLPVVDHGAVRGVISRDQILRWMAVRAELVA